MYGSSDFLILPVTAIITVCIGIYLCKYKLKYVILSILGLALFSAFLSLSMLGITIELENINKIPLALFLRFIFPIVVFCLATVTVVRLGIQRLSRQPNSLAHESFFHLDTRTLQTKWLGFLHWFSYKENIVICIIAGVILLVHFFYIDKPSFTIGDENYYVSEANRILHGQPLIRLEHPPLAKWFIAAGILIFGNDAVGWRIASIIFGVISIFVFYFICSTLVRGSSTDGKTQNIHPAKTWGGWFQPAVFIPVLATFIFASDTLSFSQGHVAMLDVFSFTLMLVGFLTYLKGRYLVCGIVMGLSILCKETAVFGVFVIVLHWFFTRHRELIHELRFMWHEIHSKKAPINQPSSILGMSTLLTAVLAAWFFLLPLLEYAKTPLWGNPFGRILYIYWHSLALLPNSGFQIIPGGLTPSPPWTWLIQPNLQDYNFTPHVPHYLISIGWTIWVLIIPAMVYVGWKSISDWKNCANIVKFTLFWFLGIYGSLIITDLLVGRAMYVFYFYPAVPAVCLAIAWIGWKLWQAAQKRARTKVPFLIALSAYLICSAASFLIMSPIGTSLTRFLF
jgi:predicted membrane-bound dolichyl-phosphate-mannose-protein mannosyltransferase